MLPQRVPATPRALVVALAILGAALAAPATASATGSISGHVTDQGLTALQGICANATTVPFGPPDGGSAQTDASGNYTITNVPAGTYRVSFFDCTNGNYVPRWYNGKPDFGSADPVGVTDGNTTSGIGAALAAAGHITGHVTNQGLTALQGICVQAYDANGQQFSPSVGNASTDSSGNYNMGGLPPGSYKVGFTSNCPGGNGNYVQQWYNGKPDFGSADAVPVTAGQTTQSIGAVLAPAGHISGHVEDAGSHTALQNICVSAQDANAVGPVMPVAGAMTDGSGNYDMGGVPAGTYHVNFSDCQNGNYVSQWYNGKPDPGSADPVTVTVGQTTQNVNASMAAAGHISGHVEDANSHTGLQNICVQVFVGSAPDPYSQPPVGQMQTDNSGNYNIGTLAAGSYKVQFHDDCGGGGNYIQQWYNGKPDFGSADAVSVTAGQTTQSVNASLQLGGHITGHVEDAGSHTGLQNICVNVQDGTTQQPTPPLGGTNTDANGDYNIGGLPTGTYKVQFHDDCGGGGNYIQQWYNGKPDFQSADTVPVTAGQTTQSVNASLQLGGHITGRVEDADSHTGLQNICVNATTATATQDQSKGVAWANTDNNGNYDMRGVPAGNVKVNFNNCGPGDYIQQWYNGKPDFQSADPVPVTAGQTTPAIDASLHLGGHITGHVQDADSQTALQNICIDAAPAGQSPDNYNSIGFAQTDQNGNYDLGGLPAGDYKIQFHDDCGGGGNHIQQWFNGKSDYGSADTVTVTAGQTTPNVNASLQLGGHVTGHVQDADSQTALQNICVEAVPAGQPPGNYNSIGFAQTDQSGNYDIGGLPAGDYKIQFHDDCGGGGNHIQQWYNGKPDFQSADAVTVTAGQTTPNVNASLQLGGHVTGHVKDVDSNAALQGICVDAVPAGQSPDNYNSIASVQTDQSGNYDLGGLPAGDYKIQFHDDCNNGPANYIQQWFNGKADFSSADAVTVTAGQTTPNVNASLQLGGHITGHVKDADSNAALANVCIDVNAANGNGVAWGRTGQNGDYDVGGVPAGNYKVQFHDERDCGGSGNYVSQWYDGKASFDTADTVPVTLGATTANVNASLHLGGHITGHVQASGSNAALQNICIDANVPNSDQGGFAHTDQSGNYDIGGLPAGSYVVHFHDDFDCGGSNTYVEQFYNGKSTWNAADLVPVTAGNTTPSIDATLIVGGHITGHVQNEANAPLQNVCVFTGGDSPNGGFTRTDQNGNYDIGALGTGSYSVNFSDCNDPKQYADQTYNDKTWFDTPDSVAVTAGSTTPTIDATLHSGATITGHVTDAATHDPVPNVCVSADMPADATIFKGLAGAQTDSNGNYTIGGLPPGSYVVSFQACDYPTHNYAQQWFNGKVDAASANLVTLTQGEHRTGVDAAMSGTSTRGDFPNGGTLTTGSDATASNPVIASVTLPPSDPGPIQIDEDASITASTPSGFTLFGKQFVVEAPPSSASDPLTISFTIDASLLTGIDPSTITVFRNGTAVAACSDGSSATTASPDPCLKSKASVSGGDLKLTILTSQVSTWNTGYATAAPGAETGGASGVTTSAATVSGTVNPHGLATAYHFEYGTTTDYGSSTSDQGAGSGTGGVAASASLSGLAAGTTYHYRLVATSAGGTSRGADQTFTTASPPTTTTTTTTTPTTTTTTTTPVYTLPPPSATTKVKCIVPKLKGLTLKKAKKALTKAHCRLGNVKKKKSGKSLRGKVVSSNPAARKVKPAGTKVALVIGK